MGLIYLEDILITFKIAIKTWKCADGVFSQSFYMDARLSDTFGMSTTHVDCKHQLRVRV